MASVSFYEVLGVHPSASQDEIKKSYRKLAMRWHPDKNPDNVAEAEERFKAIAEAYETLGDERKREEYDRYGATPMGGGDAGVRGQAHRSRGAGGGMSFAHANDIFRAFFGGRDPFEGFFDDFFGDPFFGDGRRDRDRDRDRDRGRGRGRGGLDAGFPFGGGFFGGGLFGGGGGGGLFGDFGGGGGGGDLFSFATMGMPSLEGGATAVSRSSSTVIQNGRKVTRTTTTQRFADGREETRTEETVDDVPVASSGGRLADAPYGGRARLQDSHSSGHRHTGSVPPGHRSHVPVAHTEDYSVHHYSRHRDSQPPAHHDRPGGAHAPSVRTPAPVSPLHMSSPGTGAHGGTGFSASGSSHRGVGSSHGYGVGSGSGYGVGGRTSEAPRSSGSATRRH